MRWIWLTVILLLAGLTCKQRVPSNSALHGILSSNGGDLVFCTKGDNTLEGYYSLDYLATDPLRKKDKDLVAVASWREFGLQLQKRLKEIDQGLMRNIRDRPLLRFQEEGQTDLVQGNKRQ